MLKLTIYFMFVVKLKSLGCTIIIKYNNSSRNMTQKWRFLYFVNIMQKYTSLPTSSITTWNTNFPLKCLNGLH
jgi:hypothetical protein